MTERLFTEADAKRYGIKYLCHNCGTPCYFEEESSDFMAEADNEPVQKIHSWCSQKCYKEYCHKHKSKDTIFGWLKHKLWDKPLYKDLKDA